MTKLLRFIDFSCYKAYTFSYLVCQDQTHDNQNVKNNNINNSRFQQTKFLVTMLGSMNDFFRILKYKT